MSRKEDFISEYRQRVTAWLEETVELTAALREEWDALDYSTTLTQADFTGENSEILVADLQNAVATMGSVDGLLDSGHRTNLLKVRM